MASIITNSQQVEALEKINENLELLKKMNLFLAQDKFQLSLWQKKKQTVLDIEDEMCPKVAAVLRKTKLKYVKEIKRLAAKQKIELSSDDLNVIAFGLEEDELQNPDGADTEIDIQEEKADLDEPFFQDEEADSSDIFESQ